MPDDTVEEAELTLIGTMANVYFSYSPETGFDLHETCAEAEDAAATELEEFRLAAGDGWDESVTNICFGVVLGDVFETERIPWKDHMRNIGASDDELADPPPFSEYVDYSLRVRRKFSDDKKRIEKLEAALGDALSKISRSRKVSIGAINSHYSAQIPVEKAEAWRDALVGLSDGCAHSLRGGKDGSISNTPVRDTQSTEAV